MEDSTKCFLKQLFLMIGSGLIGGLFACMLICMFCQKPMVHHHFHHKGHHGFNEEIMPFSHPMMKMKKHPKIDEEFIEEEYIIIPKDFMQKMKDEKPFDGPRPKH